MVQFYTVMIGGCVIVTIVALSGFVWLQLSYEKQERKEQEKKERQKRNDQFFKKIENFKFPEN